MNAQNLIEQSDLDMTFPQVKAFFLGAQLADKPLPYPKALKELTADVPGADEDLEGPLKELWKELEGNQTRELGNLFQDNPDIKTFIDSARGQLDYFLTALSLAGTNPESAKDEDFGELIEVLEEMVEDMDDFLSDTKADSEDGEEMKEYLLSTWAEFMQSRQ